MYLIDALPLVAACFALPQFLPQLGRIRRTNDIAGLTPAWPALTSLNNAAWIVYFVSVGYWSALVPNVVVVVTSGLLARAIVARRLGRAPLFPTVVLVGGWGAVLASAVAIGGASAVSVPLTIAFFVQAIPSLWAAYTTHRPTGISRGTWGFVLFEMSCWLGFGIGRGDAALTVLGTSGVTAAALMLARAHQTARMHTHDTHPARLRVDRTLAT